jgi:hypothetical protein
VPRSILIEEIQEMDRNFEEEKNEVEKSFLKFMTEVEEQRQILAEKDNILFHRKSENFELKEMFEKKDKECRGLHKIVSKLNKDILEFKAIEGRCSAISNVLFPSNVEESETD